MKRIQKSSSDIIPSGYLWTGLIILAVVTLAPFVYLVASSLSNKVELLDGHLIPHHPTFLNYVHLFQGTDGANFLHAMLNSVEVAILTTLISMIIGVFAAYAFARLHFPFRITSLFAVLAMQILPSVSIIVPLYVLFRNGITIGIPFTHVVFYHSPPLLDTIWALVVAYTAGSLPFVIWLMSGYFQSVPKELEEAATVDGTGRFGTMFKIILPLSLPGLAATFIFTLLNNWDEFMFASAFTTTFASKTVPVAIQEFIGRHSMDWGLMTAGGFIATLPPVIISFFFYRYIVNGVTAGGVKG
ncbi:carbohydrate ABC transporter permease [Alicyclobacillus dauci]|uniref:Carbohydrate ABC transporter permease n=1 Tax=Alicyclobacillus dauci TaxID=1475485 RepID=A0ABY6Z1F5_9BACL|nr:carbohydrate ABC transporter permease [Alicyclobacillus dauci]WAH36056.1 carbohydrate ABC transporter permease [Alicyclobacillus dauci]